MKKDMPLEGLRWSRDSGSTLCDTPQNGRSRTGWGGYVPATLDLSGDFGFFIFFLNYLPELSPPCTGGETVG